MKPMKIRKINKNEWSDLQVLNNEVFIDNAKYDSDIIIDWAMSEVGKKYFQELVNDTESVCFVVENDLGKLVGYIAGSPKPCSYRKSKYFEIDNMGVIPEYRSQGIGAKLMEECKGWAKENGYHKLFVTSYFANNKAITFYKKTGFEEIDLSLELTLN